MEAGDPVLQELGQPPNNAIGHCAWQQVCLCQCCVHQQQLRGFLKLLGDTLGRMGLP